MTHNKLINVNRFSPQEPLADKPENKKNGKPQFYECGICGYYHPIAWNGDCRDNNNRLSIFAIEKKYGEQDEGWDEVPMPGGEPDFEQNS